MLVAALGLTQIVGYGTLYYSYSILAPGVANELQWSQQWVFGILSVSLLAGAVVAPLAGRWADRVGAGRLLVGGSIAAAAALLLCALAPGRAGFAAGMLAMELASCFVLYSTAFVAVIQLVGRDAQRSITHLTLVGGFASTVFWPLTTYLAAHLTWREVLMLFAALNLLICLPIHLWLATISRRVADTAAPQENARQHVEPNRHQRTPIFWLMLVGFALEGYVLSAILVHMVPLTAALGLGTTGVAIASLFGPSQVASRLLNMIFGSGIRQTQLAVTATFALAFGLMVLLISAPSPIGATMFAILFGLGSGLMSIVGGTLPLELFGRSGYGGNVGAITAARQLSSAFAPFGLTVLMHRLGVFPALWINVAIGAVGIAAFAVILLMQQRAASNSPNTKATMAREAA